MGILIFSIVLISSFVIGETIRLEILPNIFVKPLDLMVGIISIFGILHFIISKKIDILVKDTIFKFVILFCLLGLLSLLLNLHNLNLKEFISSLLYDVRFFSYAFLYILIKNYKNLPV